MERILDYISDKMGLAFEKAGYEASYGKVTVSNRPDLCEYQCNGALAAAKAYHCAPIQIAQKVVEELDAQDFSLAEAACPASSTCGSPAASWRAIWNKCGPPRTSA